MKPYSCGTVFNRRQNSGGSLRLPDFVQTSTFRLAAIFAVAFALSAIALFAFIYWQTAMFETGRIDRFITRNAQLVAAEPRAELEHAVETRIMGDLHHISFAGIFTAGGTRIIGNLDELPPGLPIDGKAHEVQARRRFDSLIGIEPVRAVAVRLGNGDVLVVGRDIDELRNLNQLVLRALALGVVPATLLSIVAGAFVSSRAQRRVKAVHSAAERIMRGNLRERLPTHGSTDDFDRLAVSVNRMLDEIERLLETVRAAGDDIAHDLRTPLTRLRTRLERAQDKARTYDELRVTVEGAIRDLDETLGLITTLLRIAEIDAGARHRGFATLDLAEIVEDLGQSYQPVAEDRSVTLEFAAEPGLEVVADPGLLLEAVANLVQNAIKFSPPDGTVRLTASQGHYGPVIRVQDGGPGIPEGERGRVFERFYRLDHSRNIEGNGLGLSLVRSIARLHGFEVTVADASPGAVFEIDCRPRA